MEPSIGPGYQSTYWMAGFRRASHELINVFEVDETYLFKYYFDNDDVVDRVKQYYDRH